MTIDLICFVRIFCFPFYPGTVLFYRARPSEGFGEKEGGEDGWLAGDCFAWAPVCRPMWLTSRPAEYLGAAYRKRKMQDWCLQGYGLSGVGDRRWWPPTYACSATLSHAPCNTALHLMAQPTAAIQPHVPDWAGSACRSLAGVPRIVMRPARWELLGYSSGVWVWGVALLDEKARRFCRGFEHDGAVRPRKWPRAGQVARAYPGCMLAYLPTWAG